MNYDCNTVIAIYRYIFDNWICYRPSSLIMEVALWVVLAQLASHSDVDIKLVLSCVVVTGLI